MNDDMRQLSRYIEDRTMIGFMPASSFFKLLPIFAVLAIYAFNRPTPLNVGVCATTIFILYLLFIEISRKFTVCDYLMSVITYKLEGEQYSERSCKDVPEEKRFSIITVPEEQDQQG